MIGIMRLATGFVAILSTMVFGCLAGQTGGGNLTSEADAGANELCQPANKIMYYADLDGDGHGDPNNSISDCTAPAGFISVAGDCDDNEAGIYPGALEVCGDKLNNDCNGGLDSCLPNLKAQWSFEDTLGPTVVDYSGNGNAGTLVGGLEHGPTNALTFDGVDDYVMVIHTPNFELASGTVSFWFKPAAIGTEMYMWSKDSNGNDQGGHLSFYMEAGGNVAVRLQSNNESYVIVSPNAVTAGLWTHVAFAFGGTEGMKLYVDGNTAGLNPYTGGLTRNLEPLAIGAGTANSGNLSAEPINAPFMGMMSDIRFHDRKLQLTEVQSLRMVSQPL